MAVRREKTILTVMSFNIKRSPNYSGVGGINTRGTGGSINTKFLSSSEFNPLSISGLVGWYDASDYSTLTFGTRGGIPTVTAWADKSGLGNHGVEGGTAANKIIYSSAGGGGIVWPDQSHGQYFQTSLIPATGAGGRTVLAVVSNPDATGQYILSWGTPYNPAPANNIYALGQNIYDVTSPIAGTGTNFYGVVTDPSGLATYDQMISTASSEFQIARARNVISTRYDGTTNVIKSGTTTVFSAATAINTGNAVGMRIGNEVAQVGTPNRGAVTVMHEILIYNRSLSDTEWNTAITGLESKWSALSFGSSLCPNYGRPINDVDLSTITSGPVNSNFVFPTDFYNVALVDSNFSYIYYRNKNVPYEFDFDMTSPVGAFAMTLTVAGTYNFNYSRPGSTIYGADISVFEQTCPSTMTFIAKAQGGSSASVNYVYPGGAPKNIIVEGNVVVGQGNLVSLTVTKTA